MTSKRKQQLAEFDAFVAQIRGFECDSEDASISCDVDVELSEEQDGSDAEKYISSGEIETESSSFSTESSEEPAHQLNHLKISRS